MPESVYIHIPFCKSKCKYCSFISFIGTESILSYVNALIKEIQFRYNGEILETLYFGGGTPSRLPMNLVERLISNFKFSYCAEITFEINPDDAELNYLRGLKNIGINRLSFGAQTFNDKILNLIGRRHNSNQVIEAIENAKNAGFNNISVDLIYGLPNQTMEILNNDLEIIKTIDIQHVSTYGLKIEEPSYFYFYPPVVPTDDEQADMYLGVNNFLENIGFKRYEISNFAKTGFESKHNMNYWNNNEYYGFGVSAHGYNNGIRYSNTCDIKEYMDNPLPYKTKHKVTPQERLEEEIFLGFRIEKGINKEEINQKFNIDFDTKYNGVLNKYVPDYIIQTDDGYKLSLQGILLSNNILADFLN